MNLRLDLGVFQNTKLMDGVYTYILAGYIVVAMGALSRHRGGAAVFYRPSPWYAVEAIQMFVPNSVSFQMETGERRWYIIGYYLSPNNTSTIESVVAVLRERL